jgi:hypothetical protein
MAKLVLGMSMIVICVVSFAQYVRICKRLQLQHPLKWKRFGFSANPLFDSAKDEAADARAQVGFLGFVFSGAYKKLNDEQINKMIGKFKATFLFGLCTFGLLATSVIVFGGTT